MTVTSTTRKKLYNGDNSTTVFPWDFKLTEEAQMKVYIDGTERAQGDATYPWSISGVPGESGNVTFTLNPPPVGTGNVLLSREMTFDQQTDYQPLDPFPAETHEAALDKLTMQVQEVNEEVGRATKTAIDDVTGADYTLPQPVADSVIGIWNGAGNAIDIGPTANEISNAQTYANNAATSETNAAASAAAAAASAAELAGYTVVTFSATPALNLNGDQTQFISMTGDITAPTTVNRVSGRTFTLILSASGADRNITYNASWRQIGALPTLIPNGKILLLSFVCIGVTEADILVTGGLEA